MLLSITNTNFTHVAEGRAILHDKGANEVSHRTRRGGVGSRVCTEEHTVHKFELGMRLLGVLIRVAEGLWRLGTCLATRG